MSALRTTSAHAAAASAAANPEPERSPRRKMSTDLMRIKNFPSSLSLRKPADPNTPPRSDPAASTGTGTGTGTFSRLRALGQSQASDGKSSRRTSRLFDAFKSSKKPPPSFEVVRKPPNRSTTSFHSSLQSSTQDAVYRSQSRLSTQDSPQVLEAPPRISLSAPTPDPSMPSFAPPTSPSVPNNLGSRPQYPPSTTRTRRLSSNLAAATTNNTRRTSDPHTISRTHSPAPSTNLDAATSGTFSLHSFRNVRSASDVSHADDPSASAPSAGAHSRVHSIISVDEYVTPGEELPEPRFLDEHTSRAKSPDINRAQSTSPVANAKPASISAAKFRQAARQRSESGTIPTLDNIHAGRPPRSRTPSQDLAAMEAVLAQTNQRSVRPADPDRRRSTGPTSVSSPVLASAAEDNHQRRKRGFFIVLSAVRVAAAGTLSGLFGGSNSALDQQNGAGSGDRGVVEDGPSPANGLRGQGFDSARLLGKHVDANGRRRTLIDVIGEIENAPAPAWPEHRRSVSAAAEAPADGVAGGSVMAPPRVRRSTDQGRGGQLAPDAAARAASLSVQPAKPGTSSPALSADQGLPSPTSPSGVWPALRTASPGMTSSSRSSMASPVARPASASPAERGAEGQLSAQQLSQLNVQQGQAEMHEQYMRNYMAMMANPMLAHQAHVMAMHRQQQQHYYGRAASVGGSHLGAGANGNSVQGGAPLAAFMQPGVPNAGGTRERRAHSRTPSTSELDAAAQMASFAPYAYPMYAQQAFYPPGFAGWGGGYARPGYATTRSEIATPSSARLRSQKSDQALRPQ
ncbi:hypothetical protein PaG_06043 [Moesziomyces aphidis]|uniref:Uncharacterized protein n=1 Tax=Moesziomyces aphidis TaxID=84754 RepID=W3VEU2_MOEAP|nr:hypothetical protein PaG_06043 [Moesziomyces aphidis]